MVLMQILGLSPNHQCCGMFVAVWIDSMHLDEGGNLLVVLAMLAHLLGSIHHLETSMVFESHHLPNCCLEGAHTLLQSIVE